ncbi:MAG TPA: hypothetical protein VJM49_05335, partial [Acidimicrobiales bacterium]|nr:hypothetical protein [Acidimicrobiales bacterium]
MALAAEVLGRLTETSARTGSRPDWRDVCRRRTHHTITRTPSGRADQRRELNMDLDDEQHVPNDLPLFERRAVRLVVLD